MAPVPSNTWLAKLNEDMASLSQQLSSPTSPYSLSNEDMEQLTDELDEGTVGELTTAGRTYEELVASNQRHSVMSSETEDSEEHKAGRQSVGFMLGRNSLSNWSTVGGGGGEESFEDDVPTSILAEEQINTGRKSNLSRHSLGRQSLETPGMSLGHVNVSRRGSNLRSGSMREPSKPSANGGGKESMNPFHAKGRRSQSLNVSHISSSSDETNNMGDNWSSIRSSLDDSFARKATATTRESIGHKANGSLSPIEHRESKSPAGKSPKRDMSKSPKKSTSRSPLGDVSPNRKSPVRSRNERPSLPAKKSGGLSPNGTYSLKEAEGKRLSLPSMATSNMSLSSGTTETTDSSATLLTEMAQGSQQSVKKVMPKEKDEVVSNARAAGKKVPGLKMALPSLSSNRKQKQSLDSGKRVPTLTTAKTTLSPEKNALTQARSPAPTPNSQRRVVKRFRASIPMANYHLPEDEKMEDSLERREQKRADEAAANLRRGRRGSSTQRVDISKQSAPPEKVTETESRASEYCNSFEFPEKIPAPSAKTLCVFHDQAVANGSISHQYQLNRAATNLVSLHEVILPSIACETNSALKQKQAIAQRNAKDGLPDSQGAAVVEAIEVCRKAVSKCTVAAMKAGGESFRTRERERGSDRVKRHEAAQAEARRNRKEARAKARRERYAAQKGERQRNHPRNKELWQEVTRLMVDIQKLEKEERQWNDALAEVKRMEENRQPPGKVDLTPPPPTSSSDELLSSIDGAGVGLATSTLVQDVTLAAERVNWTLQRVSAAMAESDRIRAEAFDKYEYDGHKYFGYAGGDAKEQFMTLSAESPGGNW